MDIAACRRATPSVISNHTAQLAARAPRPNTLATSSLLGHFPRRTLPAMNRFTLVKSTWVLVFALVGICAPPHCGAAGPAEDFGTVVRQFSAVRHKTEETLAKKLALPITKEAQEFFEAAKTGDAVAVSNLFQKLLSPGPPPAPRPEYRNELWAPIHETLGLYEVWVDWKKNSALLNSFTHPVMVSLPAGSIYFGGTDHGRFLITAVTDIQNPAPIYCITQNALADTTYMDYLRTIYGKQLWIPSKQDSQRAFQEFVRAWQDRRARGIPLEDGDGVEIAQGQVQVRGVKAVMNINAILCHYIHDHNKDAHAFYVEESYVLDWMYPALEPHGLIMKLNKAPLANLSEEIIAKDRRFWSERTESLLTQPGFADNRPAQLAFAKMRSAIAGLYAFRQLDDEAELAFRQALQLCPVSPEANLSLAKLLERRGQVDRATELLKKFIPQAPLSAVGEAQAQLKALENQRPLTPAERQLLTGLVHQLGAPQFTERSAARQQLADFGPRALPLLREQANNKDPEISLTIGKLIRQLSPQRQ
ncbi:MAG: hypothetical protein PCFJNLEI_00161 [Verrucomicrobiae bacterium]|nr:hypothetical protein [Verrucomicrobiae bacterium]